MKKLKFIFFILFFSFSSSLFAASDISVKAEVDKAFATIGDQINFRVSVTHSPEWIVLDINPEGALDDFEIKKTTDFSTKEKKQIVEGKNFVIVNYELGEYVIRPVTIRYRNQKAGGEVKELKTNSLYVTIESVDKNKKQDSDIKGIKGVQKITFVFWPWLLGFFVLISGIGLFLFFKKSKASLFEQRPEEILTPQDEAYRSLTQLQNSDFIKKGQMKLYFLQMSDILRHYFERRYSMKALELTSDELRHTLKEKTSRENLQLIDEVISFCDFVKFAKYIPTPLEIIRLNNQAKQVVDQTKEVVEPVAQPEPIKS